RPCPLPADRGGLAAVLVVLRGAVDRRQPRLAPLDPDLGLRPHLERRVVERAELELDALRIEGEEPAAAARAEAVVLVRRVLALELERVERPLAVDRVRAPRPLSAVGAVAAADVGRLAAHAVADGAAEAAALANLLLRAHPAAGTSRVQNAQTDASAGIWLRQCGHCLTVSSTGGSVFSLSMSAFVGLTTK